MPLATDRVLFNILAKDIEETANFYVRLAGLERIHTSDWYIVLSPPGRDTIQLGIIDAVSEFVPMAARGMAAGGYLTLVVDDLLEAFERAREMGVDLVEEPAPLAYGQTRFVIRDPNYLVVDISQPTATG